MILGRDRHVHAACFEELDDAVSALRWDAGKSMVCFNAHSFPDEVPEGAIIYNLENVPGQVPAEQALGWTMDHEVWDFSKRSAEVYGAKYVPVGYHPSMERFTRRPPEERDIDVVFTGCLNERRSAILHALSAEGLKVVIVPGTVYGIERDMILARAKLALNVKFTPDGTFEQLRCAHLVANRVPILNEVQPDMREGQWALPTVGYNELVARAKEAVHEWNLDDAAEEAYQVFTFPQYHLVLP